MSRCKLAPYSVSGEYGHEVDYLEDLGCVPHSDRRYEGPEKRKDEDRTEISEEILLKPY
jgi:hypothetical protein